MTLMKPSAPFTLTTTPVNEPVSCKWHFQEWSSVTTVTEPKWLLTWDVL